jgi:hypothetical protein
MFSNSFFGLLNSDPFDIVLESRLTAPLLGITTSLSTSLPKSTSSQSTPTEIVTSADQPFEQIDNTLTPCLP